MTITSANTSVNKTRPPALFGLVEKKVGWNDDTLHLDFGCGKYPDIIAKSLEKYGVTYVGVDPYNRTIKENQEAFARVKKLGNANTASLSNVLNVLQLASARKSLLKRVKNLLCDGGVLYATVYEGDKSGKGRKTSKDCWQENRKTDDYVREITKVFGENNVERKGKLIIAVKN